MIPALAEPGYSFLRSLKMSFFVRGFMEASSDKICALRMISSARRFGACMFFCMNFLDVGRMV